MSVPFASRMRKHAEMQSNLKCRWIDVIDESMDCDVKADVHSQYYNEWCLSAVSIVLEARQ